MTSARTLAAMTVPDEIVLATRIELGLAGRAELSELVDRRISAAARVEGVLLELATPLDLAEDEIASRLDALSDASPEHAAAMRVLVVARLVDASEVPLERAVDYLAVRVAPRLPSPLDGDCGALDDGLWLAKSGTFGSLDAVVTQLRDLADACEALLGK